MQEVQISTIAIQNYSLPPNSRIKISFISSITQEILLFRWEITNTQHENKEVEILSRPLQVYFQEEEHQLSLKIEKLERQELNQIIEVFLDLSQLLNDKKLKLTSKESQITVTVEVAKKTERKSRGPVLERKGERLIEGLTLEEFIKERQVFIEKFKNRKKEEGISQKIYNLLSQIRELKKNLFRIESKTQQLNCWRLNLRELKIVARKGNATQHI